MMSGAHTVSHQSKKLCLSNPLIVGPVQKQWRYMNTVIINFCEVEMAISP